MAKTLIFYIGRIMQLFGILTAVFSLVAFFNQEGQMGNMIKWAGAGVVEFYVGYAIIALSGKKV